MKNLVLDAINRFELLKDVNNVTVALSGGADSISLLYVMVSLKDRLGITVDAAHLNHMIRGEEADRDEAFVTSVCEKLGVRLFSERINVPAYAEKHHLSTELAARELRYDFLERVNTGVVATAHTASDNLETVLFNLTRGSTLKGLCGIPPKRGIFIRPLLLCTRADIEGYCSEHGLNYVTDSTNLCDDYTRNKIRHKVVPVLKSINPSVEKTVIKTALSLTEDETQLDYCADSYLSEKLDCNGLLDVSGFADLFPAIAKRIIKKYFEKSAGHVTLDNRHICDIYSICLNSGRVSLPCSSYAIVENSYLRFDSNIREKYAYNVEIKEKFNDLFKNGKKINNLLLKNSLDCDKIKGKLVVRTRMPGDSIRLQNRTYSKSLKKLYNECHIPVEERETLPVISDDKGVIWICGIGPSHRCAVAENSEKILIIEVEKAKTNMN